MSLLIDFYNEAYEFMKENKMSIAAGPYRYEMLESYYKHRDEYDGYVLNGEDTERCECRILSIVPVYSENPRQKPNFQVDLLPSNSVNVRRGILLKRTVVVKLRWIV